MTIRTLIAFVATAAVAGAADSGKVLWEGTSGGYSIHWTTADLTAQKAGSPPFSLKPMVERGFAAYRTAMAGDGAGHCIYQRTFEVISIVGPLIGLRDRYYTSCAEEAHPSVNSRLTTIDLTKPDEGGYGSKADEPLLTDLQHPGKVASLESLFPPERILVALIADPVLKSQVDTGTRTLAQLIEGLDGEELEIPRSPCKQSMPKDILTRFAIHHVETAGVAVRLALEPVGGACQSSPADLGLLMPAPDRLREALRLANERKEGFLQSGKAITGKTTIEFSLESRRSSGK